ncbi:MAG: DUF2225 domain-containing protein [Spirochaetota bacterium]
MNKMSVGARASENKQSSSKKISFYQKEPISCPVCSSRFRREEMLSGGGRLIARDITDELRRIYVPGKNVGEVNPLVYPVVVCPECWYAAYPEDFSCILQKYTSFARSQDSKRKKDIKLIFPVVDFKQPRNLFSGTASYILAMGCYSFHKNERAPTFKKGLSALRAAWLFSDLNKKYPGQNYDKLRIMMYKKAMDYYQKAVSFAQTGKENIDSIKHFGPDLDKNYGYQGALFISTLLLFKYGAKHDPQARISRLNEAKRIVSRIFGTGKSTKNKPSLVLELARGVYEKINQELEEVKQG